MTDSPETADPPGADPPGADAWPEIDASLLEDGRPDLPEFPLACLPPFWARWTSETAAVLSAPVDYLAQALLGAVAGVCGAGVVARVTELWDEPLVLWLALVGGPSNGKSPALDAMRRALAAVESFASARGPRPHPGREGDAAACPARPRGQAAGRRPAVARRARRLAGGARLQRPPRAGRAGRAARRLVAATHRPGPEQPGHQPGRQPRRAVRRCRRGRLGTARLARRLGSDDGRAARLLYAWPAPPAWRSLRDCPALRESDAVNALQRIAHVADDPLRPLGLSFADGAVDAFDRQLARMHQALRACAGVEAAWVGKGRRTVPRLAAALCLLRWAAAASAIAPPPGTIDRDTAIAAGALWDYFHQHARAVLARGFGTGRRTGRAGARCCAGSAPAGSPRSGATTCAATRWARR